jgi:energy-coupling factor transport system permease protein
MGARAFAVTVIIGAALTQADPDRLLALAARLLPRSALAASIAARMMPALAHDARALADTARLRGRSLRHGTWRHRAGTAGALAVPLVGSSLERSLDVAQAMAARGYGAGPRTRLPEPRATRGEITLAALAAPLALLAGLAIAGVVGAYSFYPTLDPMTAPADVAAALAVVAVTAVATLAGRR